MNKAITLGNLATKEENERLSAYLRELYRLVNLVATGTAAPTTTPQKIGDIFINTTAGKVYAATGTSSSADWKILN